MDKDYPTTPDGRYFVASGRLWRRSDPALSEDERDDLVKALMVARRAVHDAEDEAEENAARGRVDDSKVKLGERGPVWWDDGAPDLTGKRPAKTDYADWWASLSAETRAAAQ